MENSPKAKTAKITYDKEVNEPTHSGWRLCFQRITIHHNDGKEEFGYRFIYRRPNGSLQGRGAALIPNATTLQLLTDKAKSDGWFE